MPLYLPDKCLRNLEDCEPYAQFQSDEDGSFICMGKNDGTEVKFKQDEFRFCWKNESVDECSDMDRRDILDTISILSQGLSMDENIRAIDPPELKKETKDGTTQ